MVDPVLHEGMFSHQFYNVVHIVGLVLMMTALGGMVVAGASAAGPGPRWIRWMTLGFHGFGAFLILLGGFGMLARLGIVAGHSWPGWIWAKVIIWGLLGVAAVLPLRFPRTALPLLLLLPVLGGTAAYMAIYKPF